MALAINTSGGNNAGGSGTTLDVALTGIASGDLIVFWTKWEGADTTCSVADTGGTDNFTTGTKLQHSNGDLNGQWHYFIGATVTGSVTYRMTLSASRTWRKAICFVFTPDGGETVTLADQSTGQGTSTNPTSSNITISGTDLVALGAYGEYSGSSDSSWQVNGSTTGVVVHQEGPASAWYKILTSGFTGNVDVTISASADWLCHAIAFDSASAGGATPKFLTLLGVGM